VTNGHILDVNDLYLVTKVRALEDVRPSPLLNGFAWLDAEQRALILPSYNV
jgi:hypothetical protein